VTVAVILLALLCSGCAAIPAGAAVSAIFGGISTYQRWEDRNAQKDQTSAIREQTAEVIRLREAIEARWPELTGAPGEKGAQPQRGGTGN
jgi:hypothetical protein